MTILVQYHLSLGLGKGSFDTNDYTSKVYSRTFPEGHNSVLFSVYMHGMLFKVFITQKLDHDYYSRIDTCRLLGHYHSMLAQLGPINTYIM